MHRKQQEFYWGVRMNAYKAIALRIIAGLSVLFASEVLFAEITTDKFNYQIIDSSPAGSSNAVMLVEDVDRDGDMDIIVGGKTGTNNVVWYEYPGWTRHVIGTAQLEAGGDTSDIDGDGDPDLVAGNDGSGNELYWFQAPDDPRQLWTRYLIQTGSNQ